MRSLVKAFEQMRAKGLIAYHECYCLGCGRYKVLEEASTWRQQGKDVKGFAYIFEWDPMSLLADDMDDDMIPVFFWLSG